VRPFSHIATISIGLSAVIVAACNGPTSSFAPSGSTHQSSRPTAKSTSSPTPIPFVFQTVDNPNSNTNWVTGINQLAKIIGVYGGGQGSNIPTSYTSVPPYNVFRGMNYPGAQGTYMTSLSSNKIQAGWVINPGNKTGIYGVTRIGGLWTLFSDPNEGNGSNAVTKIWGINDSEFAVGNYLNASGTSISFELDVPTNTFTDILPPGAIASAATGINGKGEIAGWEELPGGTYEGWFLSAGTFYTYSYPGSVNTYTLSLNWQDQIVGDYSDSSGQIHGFVLTGPTHGGGAQFWQSVDEPNATQGTWIAGISNHDQICGWYVDAANVQHGFAAVP
jgi:hypothetical protein